MGPWHFRQVREKTKRVGGRGKRKPFRPCTEGQAKSEKDDGECWPLGDQEESVLYTMVSGDA